MRGSTLALLFLLTGCGAQVKTGGYVAADGRAFARAEKYAGQARGDEVSLVAEPEVSLQSESGSQTATLRPFYRLDAIDEKRSHADLRQASLRGATEHVEVSAGVGSVTWGVLESYRPTDVVNQLDFVEGLDAKDAKLGQPFAEVGLLGEKASLKLYALPWFRDRTFQGLRGRPRLATLVDTERPLFETKARRWQPSGALRFAWQGGDLDLGVGVFTGISREPRFVAELTTGEVLPAYDLLHQASADVQWTLGGFVLKGEGFVRVWSKELRVFGGGGAGVDYTFAKAFGDTELSLAAEFLFDTRPPGAAITFFEHDAFLGARLGLGDAAGTEVTAGAIVDVTDGTTFGRAGVARRFGDHLRASLTANVFLAPSGKLESAFVRDDNALLRLAYFF